MNKFLLSIIIPCYNEAENLKEFYRRAKAVLAVYEYYLLFIDDGSTDGSLEILKNLAAADDRVRYVHLSRNFGHQNALKAGYDHARDADCVVCMDADIQHPPELIPQLIAQWQKGYKVVNTRRMDNGSEPVLKRLASKGFYSVINRISNLKLVPGGLISGCWMRR
ncbi:glycosyltransferase family 2 protein [Anseongella ginsenosidimutans]|uniref:glycosyltransferase family 2 protein n=1 Tax=Anseongella ginsenosidimutans TaxID=496056 RepID=UPI0011CA0194|nr:glycosyltransferase family 2 protein [Anseongella ginsenosidimutans]QEC52455.1 glycosyltransferase family 2 protein [Anseongella ginsenosidimutans]